MKRASLQPFAMDSVVTMIILHESHRLKSAVWCLRLGDKCALYRVAGGKYAVRPFLTASIGQEGEGIFAAPLGKGIEGSVAGVAQGAGG